MALSIVSYTESGAWTSSGTSKQAANVSWSAGDLIVTLAGLEDASQGAPPVPSATGLVFNSIDSNAAASTANTRSAYAIAGSAGGPTNVGFTIGTAKQGGISVWVISGASDIGDHKEQHTSTKTVASTRVGTDPSIYVWCCVDFAGDGVGSGSPAPTNTRENSAGASDYLVCDLTNVSSNQSYGETGGGASGPFSLLVVEIVASTLTMQNVYPDADTAAGSWTTTPLWSKVDEVSAGGDVITSDAAA